MKTSQTINSRAIAFTESPNIRDLCLFASPSLVTRTITKIWQAKNIEPKRMPARILNNAEPAFLVRYCSRLISGCTARIIKNTTTKMPLCCLSPNFAFLLLTIVRRVVSAMIKSNCVKMLSTLKGRLGSELYELIP